MGGGIAMSLANIGIPVTLIDANTEGLARGLQRVKDNYATTVKRGKLQQTEMDQRVSLITGSLQIADVKDADMVIEAVFEDMGLKQGIFRQLDALCPPGAIFATTPVKRTFWSKTARCRTRWMRRSKNSATPWASLRCTTWPATTWATRRAKRKWPPAPPTAAGTT
jgi:hypothetical protein